LTVTVGEGITGTPATGSYNYTDGDLVNYSYSLQTGYENLVVKLDGVTMGNNGIIAMNTNHILNVSADKIFDVRGEWSGILTYGTIQYDLHFTFSGGLYSGTVSGSLETIGNGNGTYTVTNGSIEFRQNYPAAYWIDYSGTVNNENNITGTFLSKFSEEGTWDIDRD
ncbi:MAG: hypothetical protein KAT17_03480, partial [Candidatus Aminicenantes bacterium]|nr:hypothetical protein [Candidatus Aminicenantes bacterium]